MSEDLVKASNLDALQSLLGMTRMMRGGNPFNPLDGSLDDGSDEVECLGIAPYLIRRDENGKRIFDNLIVKDSAFGKLPRPAALPVADCPISVSNNLDCQELVTRLWDGNFAFKIAEPIPRTRQDKLEITVWVRSEASEDITALGQIVYRFVPGGNTSLQCKFTDAIERYLNEQQMSLLGVRVMHHILRQFGWMLSWLFLETVCGVISAFWSQSKKYKRLNLDLLIIKADLMYNIPSSESRASIADTKAFIAEQLDAQGRFSDSEELSIEISSSQATAQNERARAYFRAGISCKRDVRYDDSLEHMLQGLRIITSGSGNFDWNHGDANAGITNLLLLHHEIYQDKQEESYEGRGIHKLGSEEILYASLACLLSKSKFVSETCGISDIIPQNQLDIFAQRLKSAYHKPKKAKQILLRAFRSKSTLDYKKVVRDAMKERDMVLKLEKRDAVAKTDELTKRIKAKVRALRDIKDKPHNTFLRNCNNCFMLEPPNDIFKNCQCHTVCFCSKECQVENWKVHKRTCPWHIEKKKQKNK